MSAQTSALPYTRGPSNLAAKVRDLPPPVRRAFRARLNTFVGTLTGATSPPLADALDLVADHVGDAPDLLWLAHSVLTAELPTDEDMADLLIRARLGGTWSALDPLLGRLASADRLHEVEVIRGAVTCDVHTTVQSRFLSGIQRVVSEMASRWQVSHDVAFVAWVRDMTALRRIKDDQHQRLFGRPPTPREDAGARGARSVVVPWEGTHVWGELITDLPRTNRLLALARHSRSSIAVLGHDCIPVTSAATVADGMTSHFVRSLAAVRRADRVALVSRASAQEFAGVMAMGAGRRDKGPEVAAVPLAIAARESTEADLAEARAGMVVDGMPMVLVVGSHEPRKNHLAVLHAAEVLWREGLRFNLVLLGAGSWHAEEFHQMVAALTAAGRPVQSIRGLPDRLLWAAYRLAHCTLFPSLNEGFGLPVAESLAAGTPVVTSRYGSMRDIVAPDGTPLGGLLVDPRDDDSIVSALRTMLTDDETYGRLKAETALHTGRTWDQFADELWSYLVEGVRPDGSSEQPAEPSPA